ncbi:MAG: DUF2778 domain-containing protein [Xanthobacteraceae bacterium]
MTAAAVMAGAVTAIAAGMIAVVFAANPNLKARMPRALEAVALTTPDMRLAGAANFPSLALVFTPSADAPESTLNPADPLPHAGEDREAALPSAPTGTPQLPANRPSERAHDVPLPSPRPLDGPQSQSQHEIAGSPAAPALPQVAAASPPPPPRQPTSFSLFQKDIFSQPARDNSAKAALPQVAAAPPPPPPPEPASFNLFQKPFTPQQARNNSISSPGRDSRTAIYDIEAHAVYLPNGVRLEAHSGLGSRLDDPRYVNQRDRGATPPNVYDLVLRSEPFHGVRAIRLNPVDDGRMFGRDGILAHTYMLGPTGQSFGCVSFKNYPEFLEAFLRGEIDRLVVVPHLETRTSEGERARRRDADRYAFDNR